MTITFLAPDGVPVTAQQFRQANAAAYGGGAGRPLGGRSGFRVDTPANILTATATTWTLGPCSAMIDPGASTHQGMYGWATDANITGSVTAADATNARKDIVYIQMNDSSAGDGSGAKTANVAYLAGSATATPVAPALPARSFLVGTIDVPKAGAGAPVVTLNPARFVAAGGVLPVSSAAERDALVKYDGLTVKRMDIAGRPNQSFDGSKWSAAELAPLYRSGVASVTTNTAGYATLNFATPFPGGLTTAALTDYSPSLGALTLKYVSGNQSSVDFRVFASTGATVNSTPVTVTYIATGY